MANVEPVEVLICGGGPVGLLTAYCLERYGISTHIIEQHDRAKQTMYGRAAMIAPRSMEMLDQLDLGDALGQIGFVVRGQISYKDGERVESVSSPSSNITDTFFDYLLLCRQRYTEDVIHDAHVRCGGKSASYGAKMIAYRIDDESSRYPVVSTIQLADGGEMHLRSSYVLGADGGRSTIRELAGIAFEGGLNNRYWVRIDGIVKTDMPHARQGTIGIQSSSHGSVLWACLDHGRTRVGFALPHKLWEDKRESITQSDVVQEAQEALRPFNLEFETVDWWTVYSVGQRLASQYRKEKVFIAGDAAHTHSSGAAQGLNTGIHDAINLSWKLAGYIKGWYSDAVLDTYGSERKPIAEQIIQQDKIVSVLIGGEIPKEYQGDTDVDPHKLLTETYKKNSALNTGLGIHYPPNSLIDNSTSLAGLNVPLGARAPDVLIQRPGIRLPIRLYSTIKFNGKFTIITFCGDPNRTGTFIRHWQAQASSQKSYRAYPAELFQHTAIVATNNDYGAATEKLGAEYLGNVYYDTDNSAHRRYDVPLDRGAILVLRPDGVLGAACDLTDGYLVSEYFSKFLTAGKASGPKAGKDDRSVCESAEGEIELERDV